MVSSTSAEEALGRLTPHERGWVTEFVDHLRARFGPRVRDLRLFGSKARGDDHDESDIDILVLIERPDEPTTRSITDAAGDISPWLSPVVVDFDRYHAPASRASGFYEVLRRESIRL